MTRAAIGYLALALLAGCESDEVARQENHAKWQGAMAQVPGHRESMLYEVFGAPTTTFDADGRHWIVFDRTNQRIISSGRSRVVTTGPGYTGPYITSMTTEVQAPTEEVISEGCVFIFSAVDGVIKSANARGPDC